MNGISASVPTPYGTDARWWVITTITYDFVACETTVLLAGYADEQACIGRCQPLGVLNLVVPATEFALEAGRPALYELLARLPVFSSTTAA